MKRWFTLALFVVGFPAVADSPQEVGGEADRLRLIGTWVVVELEADGRRLPRDEIKDLRFVFTPERIVRRKGRTIQSEAAYRIDPSRMPGRLDMLDPSGKQTATVPMIYALEGVRLKLCFRADYKKLIETGKAVKRPDRFDGGDRSGQVLLILERAKRP